MTVNEDTGSYALAYSHVPCIMNMNMAHVLG
jgi:hypothetical protein